MARPLMKAKTGELWKADPQGRNWKKRFFVLGQGKISYFLSREASQSKPDRPKGYFLIQDIDDIVDRPHPSCINPPSQCGFYIQVGGASCRFWCSHGCMRCVGAEVCVGADVCEGACGGEGEGYIMRVAEGEQRPAWSAKPRTCCVPSSTPILTSTPPPSPR